MPPVDIRPMTTADIPLGMRLKHQAGWNQLERDWERVLAFEPEGCFVGSLNGTDVGTVATTTFDDVAWVSMMLVEGAARGRGVGRALMVRALEYLDRRGSATIRLDATPLGKPLYESLGFSDDLELVRYAGRPQAPSQLPGPAALRSTPPVGLVPLAEPHLEQVARLDQRCTGTNRRRFLERLWQEWPDGGFVLLREREVAAFALRRRGYHGTLVGPCIGRDQAAGSVLEHALRHQQGEPVFVDVPTQHAESRQLVETWQLGVQRSLWRMTRGPRVQEDPRAIWASGGPEKG